MKKREEQKKIIYHKINRADEKFKRVAWKIFLLELLRSSDGKFSEFSVHFLLKNFEKKVENVNYESHFMSLYAFGFCASTWKMNASFLFFISRKISFLSRSNQITPQCERWKVLIFNLRNNAKRFVFFFFRKKHFPVRTILIKKTPSLIQDFSFFLSRQSWGGWSGKDFLSCRL